MPRADIENRILFSVRLPARLNVVEVAMLLGFSVDDVPKLVSADLLEPLGKPKQNSVKYFSSADILEKANDPKWLNKATQAIYNHWTEKNGARNGSVESEANDVALAA
jgi:hypothetical protein